jgi:hypothetical protein
LCLGCFPMGIPSSTTPELPGSLPSSSPASMLQVVGSVSGWGRSQGTSYSFGNLKEAARQLPEEQRGIRTGCWWHRCAVHTQIEEQRWCRRKSLLPHGTSCLLGHPHHRHCYIMCSGC